MKSFIAFACLLAVAAATPYKSYGYQFSSAQQAAPARKTYSNGAKHGGYTSTYASKNTYSGSSAFAGLGNLNTIMEYVNDPYYALEKSQELLEQLNEGLPDALAKMDPGMKNDIKQVNGLILEICDKAAANAAQKPKASFNSYYSAEGVKATCDFLHKHVPEVSRGLDEPEVISNLIAKLAEFGRLSKAMADLF